MQKSSYIFLQKSSYIFIFLKTKTKTEINVAEYIYIYTHAMFYKKMAIKMVSEEITQIKAMETVSRGKCLPCKQGLELVFQCVGAWWTMPAILALGRVQTGASLELSCQ